MNTFTFYQDTEVKSWVRDYYIVQANSQEEAEKLVQKYDSLEDMEDNGDAEFDERDTDVLFYGVADFEGQKIEIYNNIGEQIK